MISKENLLKEARHYTYKPEILEKVYRLLTTLEQITEVPYLKDRFVLKGGTALNLSKRAERPRHSWRGCKALSPSVDQFLGIACCSIY